MRALLQPGRRRRARLRLAACMVTLLLAPVLSAHAGPTLDRIRSTGTVVIAHREAALPFSYVDDNMRPVGYAIDLCDRLVTGLKRRLKLPALGTRYLKVSIADRLPAIIEGRADLECGSTTNTAERREKVAFTIPHYITGTRLLVRADSTAEQLYQFGGRRVVSTRDTSPLQAVRKANAALSLGITVLEAANHAEAVDMVQQGRADAFAMDEILLRSLLAERGHPPGLKLVGKYLNIEALAIALGRDDAEFRSLVDDAMRELIFSGEAARLYERWFQRPIPPKDINLQVPMNHLLRDFWKFPTSQVPQ